jgi:hypothetical protein
LILIALTVVMFVIGPGPAWIMGQSVFDLFIGGLGVILILLFIFQTIVTARRLNQR